MGHGGRKVRELRQNVHGVIRDRGLVGERVVVVLVMLDSACSCLIRERIVETKRDRKQKRRDGEGGKWYSNLRREAPG